MSKIKLAFFGTDEFAVTVLEELKAKNLLPALIVTTPDKPQGRRLILTPPPVRVWAEVNKIETTTNPAELEANSYQLSIVASYGKIIKKEILSLPQFGTLNIHPSLLPQYRGPTPIQTAILNGDKETGVSIILLDEQVDHGPILAQERIKLGTQNYPELRDELAKLGARILAELIPKWLNKEIEARGQDHNQATFTKKIEKSDGEIKLTDKAEINFRKFRAYMPWPGIYFFDKNNKRIKIIEASLENSVLKIKKVIPEGKSEMTWEDWERGSRS